MLYLNVSVIFVIIYPSVFHIKIYRFFIHFKIMKTTNKMFLHVCNLMQYMYVPAICHSGVCINVNNAINDA